jgi:predicted nucleic acid-binding protein
VAKLYSNENFPKAVVEHLRALDHEVLTTFESGRANQSIPDEQVLAFAAQGGYAVLTQDRQDFKRLHRGNADHEGIVICTVNSDDQALAGKIDAALKDEGPLKGKLVRVYRG